MTTIKHPQLFAGVVAVVLVVGALAIADAAGADGGIALVAMILAAIPAGWLIARSVVH